jgi:hypothetical protein
MDIIMFFFFKNKESYVCIERKVPRCGKKINALNKCPFHGIAPNLPPSAE